MSLIQSIFIAKAYFFLEGVSLVPVALEPGFLSGAFFSND